MVLMLLLLAGFCDPQSASSPASSSSRRSRSSPTCTTTSPDRSTTLVARVEAMPEVASVDFVSRTRRSSGSASAGGPGPGGPHPVPESNPLTPSLEVKLTIPTDLPTVVDALRASPLVEQVIEHRGPGRSRDHRHEHVRTAGRRHPRRRRADRAVHRRQHDPARRRGAGRGDRDHAPGRRVGRVHPLAVRVRGRARRACSARW